MEEKTQENFIKENCVSCGENIREQYDYMVRKSMTKQEYYDKNGNYCRECLKRISSNAK